MTTRRLTITVAVVAALVFTATAPATTSAQRIVPFRSFGRATIGATPAAIRAALGTPSFTQSNQGRLSEYGFMTPRLLVFFGRIHGRLGVTGMQDSDRGLRTRRGVGVGSHEAAVRHAYRYLRCTHSECRATLHHVEIVWEFTRGRAVLINMFAG